MADRERTLEGLDFVDFVLGNWLIWDYCPESRKRVGNMIDPVSDALIRIKNGYQMGKVSVQLNFSKLIWKLMKLLQQEGYLADAQQKDGKIAVTLKYHSQIPALADVKRVSKPSLRVYKGVKDLPQAQSGLGIAIISTPKGLMTDRKARQQKVGGEVLALVW